MNSRQRVSAIVLAGGRGQRMGGQDKGLIELDGRPLIDWVLDAVHPQAGQIVISANRNLERYRAYGVPVIQDDLEGVYQGPLAGVAAALGQLGAGDVLTVPVDTPDLPPDLAGRLQHARDRAGAELAFGSAGGQVQYAVMLFDSGLRDSLQAYLAGGGRSIRGWAGQHRTVTVEFSEGLRNVNSEQDLAAMAGRGRLKS